MLKTLSRFSALVLAVLAMGYILPAGFDKVFVRQADEPLLFYSPVLERFIYQESLGGHQFEYRDEDGTSYSRQEFEERLPFLYFRNLERRNLLPVVLQGRSFDAETIARDRQALEIRARHLRGHTPQIQLYPLFNNDPEVAMMPFPVEVFRFTHQAMEFIDADHNRIVPGLTDLFTRALKEKGFVFPATVIGGKPTNLKPFDDGYFIRDSVGGVFHVRRVLHQPEIFRVPVDRSLDILDMVVTENPRREFHGVIITRRGEVFLTAWGDYRLIPLPVEGYDPRSMDLKLMIDPLYRTVTVVSEHGVSGVVMDADYRVIGRYELPVREQGFTPVSLLRDLLFPFHIQMESPHRGQAGVQVHPGSLWSPAGILAALALFFLLVRKKRTKLNKGELALVALTGFLGLAAVAFIGED